MLTLWYARFGNVAGSFPSWRRLSDSFDHNPASIFGNICTVIQPSAIFATRRIGFSDCAGGGFAAIQIGHGCCTGRGLIVTSLKERYLPAKLTLSSLHRRRQIAMFSAILLPRCPSVIPQGPPSFALAPAAGMIPVHAARRIRPFEMRSSVAH